MSESPKKTNKQDSDLARFNGHQRLTDEVPNAKTQSAKKDL